MSVQLPIPSFEDIRKLLGFWIDQQDKWFYFETGALQTGKIGEIESPSPNIARHVFPRNKLSETFQYSQSRIIGRIYNVVEYPPSLLLQDVTVFTVHLESDYQKGNVVNEEKRNQYGLVFSQITYYEPIENIEVFIKDDLRIKR